MDPQNEYIRVCPNQICSIHSVVCKTIYANQQCSGSERSRCSPSITTISHVASLLASSFSILFLL